MSANGHEIDQDTAEQLLDGDATNTMTPIADLLAAAAAPARRHETSGKEAALAAFRLVQPLPAQSRFQRPRLLSAKAILAALLLTSTGGIALAGSVSSTPPQHAPIRPLATPPQPEDSTDRQTIRRDDTRTSPEPHPNHPAPGPFPAQTAK